MSEFFSFLKHNSDVASAFAAVSGLAVATLAFIVSICSLKTSEKSLKQQHRHNVLSVSPLPEITLADYEDSLRVRLRNNGSGPMIIRNILVSDGNAERTTLISWMPALPENRSWNHFSTDLVNRSLLPGKHIPLLELSAYHDETEFHISRDMVRNRLRSLVVKVDYTDVYDTDLPAYEKELTWFGRNCK